MLAFVVYGVCLAYYPLRMIGFLKDSGMNGDNPILGLLTVHQFFRSVSFLYESVSIKADLAQDLT